MKSLWVFSLTQVCWQWWCMQRSTSARIPVRVRFTAAVFAIGFFLGMIAKCVVGGSYIALALYALGFVLSYTAVVFTVPEKEHAYEGR